MRQNLGIKIGDAILTDVTSPESNTEHTVFVTFKGVTENEISENYRADAEIAVQEWLNGDEDNEYWKGTFQAGKSHVYENGIVVELDDL